MKKWLAIGAAVVAVAALAYGLIGRGGTRTPGYRLVTVDEGDVESVVSATGTLSAVTTVQVGTQVSGLISRILVDFNDTVRQGQLIAELDTTLLASAVADAEAGLDRAQAGLDQATRDHSRLETLQRDGISSEADLNTARYNLDVARAAVKSARVGLERARLNLGYATITAPVAGTVVERDVEVGQTVAASLATPKLFVIAADLAEMQILASIDESDIGQIWQGQKARFTVKAHPGETFAATVKQVRLQSSTEQNVVSYTVVLSVANPERKLLPGMTATVELIVASANNVLRVPNAALRFRPTEAMLKVLIPSPGGGQARPGGVGSLARRDAGPAALPGPSGGRLFVLDEHDRVAMIPVEVGITDGQHTAVSGAALVAGMRVLAGTAQAAQTAAKNPFQTERQSGPGGGGPPPPPGGF